MPTLATLKVVKYTKLGIRLTAKQKTDQPRPIFVHFRSSNNNFTEKCRLQWIQTHTVGLEEKRAEQLTTTLARLTALHRNLASVTRSGDFLGFGQLFKAFGKN